MSATAPRPAIIFDLDDTLFDCSTQLVRQAHREAVEAMIHAGLPAEREEALRRRLALFEGHPREDVNRLLAEAYGCEIPEAIEAGRRAYLERKVGSIRPFPGAVEMLERLSEGHRLILVTAGDPRTQQEKVERLGLEDLFEAMVFLDPSRGDSKMAAFRDLSEGRTPTKGPNLDPAITLVVGDRVDGEIAAGRALGMGTLRLRSGEYAHLDPAGPGEEPDRTITEFAEMEVAIRSWTGIS